MSQQAVAGDGRDHSYSENSTSKTAIAKTISGMLMDLATGSRQTKWQSLSSNAYNC